MDLSKQFYGQYDSSDFIPAAMKAAIFDFKVYGVPWFTGASMLYYRKDLLDKYGFKNPPSTWNELEEMVTKIRQEETILYGYVFQGDKYEGAVTNACEFIWGAGGEIALNEILVSGSIDNEISSSIITIDSENAKKGFVMARHLVEKGIAPEEVSFFREPETTKAFLDGKAIFMRGWPGVYGLLSGSSSSIEEAQVGISSIPVLEAGNPSYSCLGGWNLMISSATTEVKKEAAWKFIQYLTAPAQQKQRSLESASLPSIKALYYDQQLQDKLPVVYMAKQGIYNVKSRPVSYYYMDFSAEMASVFNKIIKGEVMPELGVYSLQKYVNNGQEKGQEIQE